MKVQVPYGTIQTALCTVCSKPYGTGKMYISMYGTDNQWLSQHICCISVNAYQARNLRSEVCILVCIRTKKNRWAWYSCLLMIQQKKDSPPPLRPQNHSSKFEGMHGNDHSQKYVLDRVLIRWKVPVFTRRFGKQDWVLRYHPDILIFFSSLRILLNICLKLLTYPETIPISHFHISRPDHFCVDIWPFDPPLPRPPPPPLPPPRVLQNLR